MSVYRFIFFLLISTFIYAFDEECCCIPETTGICCPAYSGGFYGGGSWLYLRPSPTDGDFEYGSLITLTDSPANLSAILLEVESGYQSGFTAHLGYQFPCSNQNLSFNYFYFHSDNSDKKSISTENQLIQNFLGASYSTSKATGKETIHQLDLQYGHHFFIDCCLDLYPYISVGYAGIWRDFDVNFEDLVLNPTPSSLQGKERSKYWGVGPLFGTEFAFPLFCQFSLKGNVGAGVLFGCIKSKVDSTSIRNEGNESFFSKDSRERIVTALNADVALVFTQPIYHNCLDFKLEVGYRIDYFFKGVNRINPFNGYVNNPNTFPVRQSSNLGLGGPYVEISLDQGLLPCSCNISCCNDWCCSGFLFRFISAWLEPCPTGDDLTFATIQTTEGKEKELRVNPDTIWTGTYELAYQNNAIDLRARYFHLAARDKKSFTSETTAISSLNASGPAFVLFSTAESRAKYEIDEVDVSLGRWIELFCRVGFRGFLGVQYLNLKRTQDNQYLGGIPPLTTQEKFPFLKSRFCGVGPLFGIEPNVCLFRYLSIAGLLDVAFLVGEIKATLDQDNRGMLGESSNTLRTPKTDLIVPKIDSRLGLKFDCCLWNCLAIEVEGGYQYTEYFRAVNLLFPTLLTGLEQDNSNLKLLGPYLTLGISAAF